MLPSWKYALPSYISGIDSLDKVYFAEPYSTQLRADGFAIGGFDSSSNLGLLASVRDKTLANNIPNGPVDSSALQ